MVGADRGRMVQWVVARFGAQVLFHAGLNLSKNSDDASDSPVFLSPTFAQCYKPAGRV